ncbi:hypothetical protein AB4Z25_12235 [Rhizobium sp. RAF36]|uniref:hypothetical protein n=1 Tax=Rhizobium sp. RAF36 TaxID=3233055 RepID=UPI003F9A8651
MAELKKQLRPALDANQMAEGTARRRRRSSGEAVYARKQGRTGQKDRGRRLDQKSPTRCRRRSFRTSHSDVPRPGAKTDQPFSRSAV